MLIERDMTSATWPREATPRADHGRISAPGMRPEMSAHEPALQLALQEYEWATNTRSPPAKFR